MVGSKTKSVQPFLIDQDAVFHVSELAANSAGGMSPFGDDINLPLPVSQLRYTHPASGESPTTSPANSLLHLRA